jgi:ribonucleoside-diphosphate reductase alpha chain
MQATELSHPTHQQAGLQVIKRDGRLVPFDATKIAVALGKAFLAVEGEGARGSERVHDLVEAMTVAISAAISRRQVARIAIEDIQDLAELALMRGGHHKIARAYVLWREARAAGRAAEAAPAPQRWMHDATGARVPLDVAALRARVGAACDGLADVSAGAVTDRVLNTLYDGVTAAELDEALILGARSLIETDPGYSFVAARLLADRIRGEAMAAVLGRAEETNLAVYFPAFVAHGIRAGLLDPALAAFDLPRLAAALRPERDRRFQYLGLQTLQDRYFLHEDGVRFELPQAFFMRVAMGLALREEFRDGRAIEFYELLSSFDFMASTPTLFNSGTPRPQLSSCFLTTIPDDLDAIFSGIRDNALLAKYSGGIGNDWTPVRGLGAHIRGTNGESQGIVPFLKVANDTAIAVNQGGKRKGAVCAYLETWHIDVEEFLDLRKNTGDDRRRTHDMNTANWVPDLFMERVEADGPWTLFSPDEVPDLHELTGPAFRAAYEAAEARAAAGEIRVHRRTRAVDLWRRMLSMLFETGHPWITFKDPCNIRSPQGHVGTVHSSNLCTEITLNTSTDEVAVCNLGSVNLAAHVTPDGLDGAKLARTVATAMRMLDNVIDVNLYTIPQAERSNLRHRPVGLGLMGFQDALQTLRIPYSSEAAVAFADESMEAISFHAISASCDLAGERGAYASFAGSLWSRGVLPHDSLDLLAEARGGAVFDKSARLDWGGLRERVKRGMRNSNCLAIAPTATISNICGVSQSIEPAFQNLYVKSNMSGEFTQVNAALVADLKARGLWDEVMISDLKYHDGALGPIARVPEDLKALYATAFEIAPDWLVRAAARRQKWIDQAQSLNLYMAEPSGRKLDALYRLAWKSGLKTTYYLRAKAATRVEKSTLSGADATLNAVMVSGVCSLDDPTCEACQ